MTPHPHPLEGKYEPESRDVQTPLEAAAMSEARIFTVTAFYNEPDPYAAAWLRNLIAAGHIAPGIVDERPIQEIEAWELAGFVQCHFFAGIGVWSHALRRAGWPDDQPIWTGSCPCQPFSAAGQRKGISDERHLWPTWFKLIDQCKPSIVVGEQVASKDGLGWLDLVSSDMEAAGYAFGASDLCAAGFGGAHIRQRLYFVGLADTDCRQCNGIPSGQGCECDGQASRWQQSNGSTTASGSTIGLADDDDAGWQGRAGMPERGIELLAGPGSLDGGLADSLPTGRPEWRTGARNGQTSGISADGGLVQSHSPRSFEREQRAKSTRQGRSVVPASGFGNPRNASPSIRNSRETLPGYWHDVDWLLCRNPAGEPSWRPVEPGTFPLDNAVTGRMGLLRAYGNALDAETATNFCEVVREIVDDLRPLERELDL